MNNDLFHHAKEVHAVGPRPRSSRALHKLLVNVAFFACGFAAYQIPSVAPFFDGVISSSVSVSKAVSLPQQAPTPTGSAPSWMQAPHSSLYQWMFDQGVSYEAFQSHLQDKVSPEMALAILVTMQTVDGAYITGSQQPDFVETLQSKMSSSRSWLEEVHRLIQRGENPQHLLVSNDLYHEKKMLFQSSWSYIQASSPQDPWKLVEEQFWGDLEVAFGRDRTGLNKVAAHSKLSLTQSREELSLTVQKVGLAGLRVPMGVSESPEDLQVIAAKLERGNDELQRLTRFDGGVLGLNGRVVLDLSGAYRDGKAFADDHGFVHIKAWWPTLGHEWFHAFDYAQATNLSGVYPVSPLSLQHGLDHKEKHPVFEAQSELWQKLQSPDLSEQDQQEIFNAFKSQKPSATPSLHPMFAATRQADTEASVRSVPKGKSPWLYWRSYASDVLSAGGDDVVEYREYLQSPSEIMAFSFNAHASLTDKNTLLYDPELWSMGSASYQPTVVEVLSQKKTWNSFFGKNQTWWKEDQATRLPASVPSAVRFVEIEQGLFSRVMSFRSSWSGQSPAPSSLIQKTP